MNSFMVFSAVLTSVKLLVLCTGSTVRRESCNPISSAGVGTAMACTEEMLPGMSTTRKPVHHLGCCSLSESSVIVKKHTVVKDERFASETWPDYTQQRLRFPKQVWDSWHAGRQRHWGCEAARSTGKPGGLPGPSRIIHQTPHPPAAPPAECPCCGFRVR